MISLARLAHDKVSEPTRLLQALSSGDDEAADKLMPFVYDELHRMAQRMMQGERAHTLQPTALIHEAWLRLIHKEGRQFESRVHFLRVAAKAMRHSILDHARKKSSHKRGGDRHRITLDENLFVMATEAERLVEIDDALKKLAEVDGQLAQIVELRFFGGLNHPQIASALGTSLRSIERGWRLARAWLLNALDENS